MYNQAIVSPQQQVGLHATPAQRAGNAAIRAFAHVGLSTKASQLLNQYRWRRLFIAKFGGPSLNVEGSSIDAHALQTSRGAVCGLVQSIINVNVHTRNLTLQF